MKKIIKEGVQYLMEEPSLIEPITKSIKSRKNEARTLVKKCFKNNLFSLVPFEIWMMIASQAEIASIVQLSQTCWGFKELVDKVGEGDLDMAKRFRREGQIPLALKYFLRCANMGNTTAQFCIADAYAGGGLGLEKDVVESGKWMKKSAEGGNATGMAFYSFCLKWAEGMGKDAAASIEWGKKALSSDVPFAVGFCYYLALGTTEDRKKAFNLFEAAASEPKDEFVEFAQRWLGYCHDFGFGTQIDGEKAFDWFRKSAEAGLSDSQYKLASFYREGRGCLRDEGMAEFWFNKAKKQNHQIW